MRSFAFAAVSGRYQGSYFRPVGGLAKRSFDLVVSAIALCALAPLLIAVAILVRLDSPGPVLFRQRRSGYRGRPFLIYKFRTMVTQDDGDKIEQAQLGDQRVTPLGATLRRTSLDELPQLLNVLAGDMSLVGPRPHPIGLERERLDAEPKYRRRQKARPGMTGLAQVSGSRGALNTPAEIAERIQLDLTYINAWSPLLDLAIIARTFGVLFGKHK